MYLKRAAAALSLLYLADSSVLVAADQEKRNKLLSAVLLGQEQNTQEALLLKKKQLEEQLASEEKDDAPKARGRDLGRSKKRHGGKKHKRGGKKKNAKVPSVDDSTKKELGGDGDLNIRFSKVVFEDPTDAEGQQQLPLTAADYPIDKDLAQWLRNSQCPSIVFPGNCLECNVPFETLVDILGGPPTHPSTNSSSPYWAELLHVVQVQAMRKAGNVPPSDIMPLPELWKDMTMEQVAEAVHDEYPGLHQAKLISYLLQDGAEVDTSIVPQRCKVEFLRGIVMLAEVNVWAISTVGSDNFGVKYHVGRSRPEEVAHMISERQLSEIDGVPSDLMDAIPPGSLLDATSFTAYPEGCPMHPAWPAMHSAASSASLWLAVLLDLTEAQWCQAKRMDHGVAYARTVAGVHYVSDNIAGLNLGQEIIAETLPDHLAQRYGSDPKVVRAKIKSLRFDWNDFLTSDCGALEEEL